jgi:antitoxin (DNA-binding transcriptional repressor) of toxin-antitoxin stability system
MKAVAVKELKNRLSSYLREVKNGEVVLVTDRGRVVAELRQPRTGAVVGARRGLEGSHRGVLVAGLPQESPCLPAVAAPSQRRDRRPARRGTRRPVTVYAETSAVLRWLFAEEARHCGHACSGGRSPRRG